MECSGLFISAPLMTFLADLVVFLPANHFFSAPPSPPLVLRRNNNHGEQSLVQVEEPSATLATLRPCR
jgi:hypothetical protein